MTPRVPVVFVLASNYSGSHLLAAALGAHPSCADIGELRNLPKFTRRSGRNRSGTESDYAAAPLFTGLPELPTSAWHLRVLERIRGDAPAVTVLVDNSKRLDWISRLATSDAIEARPVHLLRDPRALARRWRDDFRAEGAAGRIRLREARRNPWSAPSILTGPEMRVYGYRWLRENRAIGDFLDRGFPAAPRLAYEELVADPAATLTALMPRLGLSFDPAQLDYGRAPQLGTRKLAWQEARAESAWRPDLRWREETSDAEREAVESLAPLGALLARFGFEMRDRGLVGTATPER
jgi:hypothetical protein